MRRVLPITTALFAACLWLLTCVPPVLAGDVPMLKEDLPAVRLTYDELFAALRKVREAFVRERGAPAKEDPPRERIRVGSIGSPDDLTFDSLAAFEQARLPATCRDVDYNISQYGEPDPVSAANVGFSSWRRARIYVHGDDAARMARVAAAAREAFEPFATPILSHQKLAEYGLFGLWLLMSLSHSVYSRRRWGKPSAWAQLPGLLPMLGFFVLITGGDSLLPSIVVYSNDASWWARHSSDVLLGLLAIGVTGLMLVGMKLDSRARARRPKDPAEPPQTGLFESGPLPG